MSGIKKIFVYFLVITFWPIVKFIGLFRCVNRHESPNKILIIDNAKIGDLVCATPVFRAIKEQFSQCQLVLLTDPANLGIVKNNPRLDKIWLLGRRSSIAEKWIIFWQIATGNFQVSVTLVSGTTNYLMPYFAFIPIRIGTIAQEYGGYYYWLAKLTMTKTVRFLPRYLSVQHYLDLLQSIGIYHTNLKKEVFFSPSAKQKAGDLLTEFGWRKGEKLVAIAPTSGNKIKEWPPERFAVVAEAIYRRYGFRLLFVGHRKNLEVINHVKSLLSVDVPAISITSLALEELPALLSFAGFFISVDTGPLYIANALDVPVLDIAGPCDIYDQMPIYEKCEVVHVKNLPGWPYSSVLKTVTDLTEEQMRAVLEITPEMVIEAFDRLVEKYHVAGS